MKESTSRFSIRYMHVKDYQEALVKQDNPFWGKVVDADLILGGVEFGDDFLYYYFCAER